jgi:hypothetical protein
VKTTLLSAIRSTYNAFHNIGKAEAGAVAKAKELARQLQAEFKPEDGPALQKAVREAKREAEKRVKPKDTKAWENGWNYVSSYWTIFAFGELKVSLGANQAPVVASTVVDSPYAAVREAAKAVRAEVGIGRKREPKAGGKADEAKAEIKAGAETVSAAAFEMNAATVADLIGRILAEQSGLGLIADALKLQGYGVVKLSTEPKAYPISPPKELPASKVAPKKKAGNKAQATA